MNITKPRSALSFLAVAGLVGGLTGVVAGTPAHAADDSAQAATCTNPSPSNTDLSKMTVGFSQSENLQNPFRAAETRSVREAAKQAGVKRLLYANANSDQAKQVSDIQSMINQGADALIVAPLNSTGLKPALDAAAAQHIPVVTIDRRTAGTPCQAFITFMGSDFSKQAERAARQLAQATNGKARIVELQGAYGNSVETARTQGFEKIIDQHKGMQIVAKQSANWSTTDAQRVMSQLLLSHPDVDAVYAQSDTMALGALKAIRQFGKTPGKDIKVVSIDGTTDGVKDVASGAMAADIETNPRFGPRAFQAIQDYVHGKPVAQVITMDDHLFDQGNAQSALDNDQVY